MSSYRRGRSELVVGGYAVVAVAVFALLFGALTSRGLIRSTTDLYIRLPAADGLLKGDAVLFRGVPVGEVRAIEFADDGDVVVRAKLRRAVPLSRAATAALEPVDMFGRQSIVLRPATVPARELAEGDTLAGTGPRPLAGRVATLGRQVERFLGDSTLTLLHGALAGIDGAGAEVTAVSARAAEFMATQAGQVEGVIAATDTLVRNLSRATDPGEVVALRAELRTAAANLSDATARLDSASIVALRVLAKLDRGEGALGRAMNDPELYDRAIGAVAQLEWLISDIRERPGRYVTVSLF
ncbi:MAG: MCE family protein [Gemmatimonadetes bacterium]|nr:MCE family protein [Gemmatimonadota bacterium]NIQ52004.1 MCE family protein [Gemmatimonadota bacterium]NIU72104.1 MCE family protein [Gammaproteobacteria bacterium]NIX42667.1 MCE family protein [Gemmatimonadota bacterium]NIY06828.1 MCE family protein [Gemmatimonadota bacterium]